MRSALPLLCVLTGCFFVTREEDPEGNDAGECQDNADNDRDGLFDCDDPGCAGAEDKKH